MNHTQLPSGGPVTPEEKALADLRQALELSNHLCNAAAKLLLAIKANRDQIIEHIAALHLAKLPQPVAGKESLQ